MPRLFTGFALCVLITCSTGCPSGPRFHKVTGSVTYNGTPLPEGDLTFMPEGKGASPQGGKIKDGKYEVKLQESKYRVEISASKILPGGAKGAGGEPVAEEYIPEQYNTNSKLTATVTASGPNKFDFPLESKKK